MGSPVQSRPARSTARRKLNLSRGNFVIAIDLRLDRDTARLLVERAEDFADTARDGLPKEPVAASKGFDGTHHTIEVHVFRAH